MVQVQYMPDDVAIPKEAFLSCAVAQVCRRVEETVCILIQDSIIGDTSRVEETIAHLAPKSKYELELIAQLIVSKALDEPQHCSACVSLANAFQTLLTELPPDPRGGKPETFMHALLDVLQTEFERVLPQQEEPGGSSWCANLIIPENQHRIRAIAHLAGHLHSQRLLGNGVVSQMVHELVSSGESEAANELLWFIGAVAYDVQHAQNLGTVPESGVDSDCASSD